MPELVIRTNLSKEKFPKNFIEEMTDVVAKTLGKPKKFVSLSVFPDAWMSFDGNEDPCANCALTSIGRLGPEENVKHAGAIMGYLYGALGISKERMYLSFHDSKPEDMGHAGTTFMEIFKARE